MEEFYPEPLSGARLGAGLRDSAGAHPHAGRGHEHHQRPPQKEGEDQIDQFIVKLVANVTTLATINTDNAGAAGGTT